MALAAGSSARMEKTLVCAALLPEDFRNEDNDFVVVVGLDGMGWFGELPAG